MIDVELDPSRGGPVEIRGAVAVERGERGLLPRRLRADQWSRIPADFMLASVSQCAGVRLAFRTAATAIELTVNGTKMVEDERVALPASGYELVVDGRLEETRASVAGSRFVFSFERPSAYRVSGDDDVLRFDGLRDGMKDVELWLPYTDEVELIALRADAPVSPPAPPVGRRWLHHGSSISHGYIATRTGATWPVAVARSTGVELTSAAFSGNALLDQLTARTMRDTPADLISVKVGINVVNGDLMRARIFRSAVHGFLDTLRDGHPDVPLLVVSPIFCAPVEELPGPTTQDPSRSELWTITRGRAEELAEGKLSLGAIRDELRSIVRLRSSEDAAIHYLDGPALYGPAAAAALPLPDNLHPGDDVQALMAERFARLVFGPGGAFAAQG